MRKHATQICDGSPVCLAYLSTINRRHLSQLGIGNRDRPTGNFTLNDETWIDFSVRAIQLLCWYLNLHSTSY